MADEFKIGDVVQLRSGGQEITVVEIANDDVVCQWFSKDGRLRKDQFPAACLQQKPQPLINLNLLAIPPQTVMETG